MIDFDPGPPRSVARIFARMPSYAAHSYLFWHDWGPVFYRGRLDRSARVLVVASDPGPTERIACRTLVGDAGQRVQGFLTRLGLTHGYVVLNAFAYAMRPSTAARASRAIFADPAHTRWRADLFRRVTGPQLQAVVAFGAHAQRAVQLWDAVPDVPVERLPHPSSRDGRVLVESWGAGLARLRAVVTPDDDGDPTGPTYGETFAEEDYAPIPRRDLPFGMPDWVGDDAWGRAATPKHHNCVHRPSSDPVRTLVWRAPENHGTVGP
ncbi:uracil-DNA glycosylase family protein [Oerskovia flava]|uniref:uracil-DNA glycosylase family protein n=1 Tax=Oerskovia flava TaxID=2986422 RepID=UPI00223F6DAE|nr:uracil-DNA glycosylase family protein [Oerskovia sp. JB1-3-2]